MSSGPLLSIHPEIVIFAVERQKTAYYDVKVINNSAHFVAFKVKTTSPEKYFVRPNTCVLQPWDTCIIMVFLQAQKELQPDLECKDKIVIRSTIVPPHLVLIDIPPDLFNKDDNKVIEECTLKVSYVRCPSIVRGPHAQELQRLQKELVSSLQQNKLLQQEIELQRLRQQLYSTAEQNKLLQQKMEMPTSSSLRRTNMSFSLTFAVIVGLLIGILLNCALS